jgi:PKD repeat protein
MKKIFTLLLLTFTVLSFKSTAQTNTTCNAAFDFAFLNSNTVKFTPTISIDSPFVHHNWIFGDGSPVTYSIAPTHTYSTPGTYTVKHYLSRYNPNGVFVCADSVIKLVTIQQPCNLIANFIWSSLATNPLAIAFQNLSTTLSSTDSIRWTFGDGSSSLDVNPTHTYNIAGTYTVCLRVKKNSTAAGSIPCVSEICKTVTITQPCNLQAYFNWTTVASSPLAIVFQNLSNPLSPTDSIRWTFGDGTSSLDVNPMHTYANPGTYTVCLRVKKNNTGAGSIPCVSEFCKTVLVVQTCNLQAYFNWTTLSNNPLSVAFQNLSNPLSPTDSVRWTFGDGNSSLDINPTHTYANAGTYTVCLRVKKNSNTTGTALCVSEICKIVVVTVNQTCNLTANFIWTNTAANPLTFNFQNLSSPLSATDSVRWTFGDGSSSISPSPSHTYTNPGTYTVCLRVKKNNNTTGTTACVREICKTIIVAATQNCNLVAYFTWSNTSNPLTFAFQNLSTPIASTDSIRWTFGDGSSSLDVNPTHIYSSAGTYTVCLRIKKNGNTPGTTPCVREICKVVTILPQINCDSIHVSYMYQRDPFVPNKIYFYANANFPIQDQTWTITRLAPSTLPPVILHQNNPAFVFYDTGYYRVCLKAITLGGCVKEYCSNILIEHVSQLCELQAYPNPTNNLINVSLQLVQPEMIHAFIYNTMNVLVREKHQQGNAGNNIVTINVNDLVPGLYNIKIIYGNRICYARFNKM